MYDSGSSSDGGWISWFCDLEGHEYFIEVSLFLASTHFDPFNNCWKMLGGPGIHKGQLQSVRTKRENLKI